MISFKNTKIQFFAILVVKLILAYCFPWSTTHYNNSIGFPAGDTVAYYQPLENLITNGFYYDDFRMPGLSFPYLLFRLVLNETSSLNLVIITQIVFSVLSVLALAKVVVLISKNQKLYFWVLILHALSTFVSMYDTVFLTESFFTSSLIFLIYFLLRGQRRDIIIAGFLMCWMIFLKPVAALLFPAFILIILFKNWKENGMYVRNAFIFMLPFVLAISVWIGRNYTVHKRVFLFTKSINYPSVDSSFLSHAFTFVAAFGGSGVYWNPKAEITYFYKASNFKMDGCQSLPQEIYTSKFNADSMLRIKNMIAELDSIKNPVEHKRLDHEISERLDEYALSIKNEKPFLYYVTSRFKLLKSYLIHSGTENLFLKSAEQMNGFEFFFKILYTLLYLSVVFFGIIGSIFLVLFKWKFDLIYLILPGLYFTLVYPLVMKMDEYRYLVPAYPFLLVIGIYFLSILLNKRNAHDSNN